VSDPVEDEVAALKRAAEELRSRQQRLVAQAEAAEAEAGRALERLQADFGVSSVEEAEALLAKIDAELASEIAAVREGLRAAETPVEAL
jgi:predicted  nucleic acid-binding Zn-ribbon protein